MTTHAKKATNFLKNKDYAKWHDQSLWFVREKRDKVIQQVPEWEMLRTLAESIKKHTIDNLPKYLQQFEKNASKNNIVVHWARTKQEHNEIVHHLLEQHGIDKIVKSKSMLTEETNLNHYLQKKGIDVVDTDLGEFIVQLRKEHPSHIVMPAIHVQTKEIADLFYDKKISAKPDTNPQYQTHQSMAHLRKKYLESNATITGVNFAVADTGGIVLCTNEGNADLGVANAKLHIACMGLEKIIPRFEDLSIFLRLLARSATGQLITTYSSHLNAPLPGADMHVVILDNNRTNILKDSRFKRNLYCIRCGACMNTCPIYRRSGGHSYGYTVPGPIGSVLTPSYNPKKFSSLPFASTLCGSCTNVCPVKINLHEQLLLWRGELVDSKHVKSLLKKIAFNIATLIFTKPHLYAFVSKLSKIFLVLPPFVKYLLFYPWTKQRTAPAFPKKTFHEIYQQESKKSS